MSDDWSKTVPASRKTIDASRDEFVVDVPAGGNVVLGVESEADARVHVRVTKPMGRPPALDELVLRAIISRHERGVGWTDIANLLNLVQVDTATGKLWQAAHVRAAFNSQRAHRIRTENAAADALLSDEAAKRARQLLGEPEQGATA